MPLMDTFLSAPTLRRIWNMQLVQDDKHTQLVPVANIQTSYEISI